MMDETSAPKRFLASIMPARILNLDTESLLIYSLQYILFIVKEYKGGSPNLEACRKRISIILTGRTSNID